MDSLHALTRSDRNSRAIYINVNPIPLRNLDHRITLKPIKSRRVLHGRDAHPLRLNLPNRPREPFPRPQEPAAKRPQSDDPDGNGRVVQRLAVDGVEFRQAKDDGDKADIQACDRGDGTRQRAQVERSLAEIGRIDETDEDGEAVGEVEADGGDGGGGRKGNAGSKRWDSE